VSIPFHADYFQEFFGFKAAGYAEMWNARLFFFVVYGDFIDRSAYFYLPKYNTRCIGSSHDV
jgi:hypothetical protein